MTNGVGEPPFLVFPDRAGGFFVFTRPFAVYAGERLAEAEAAAESRGGWLAGGLQYAAAEAPAPGWWGVFETPRALGAAELAAEADASPLVTGPLASAVDFSAYAEAFAGVRDALRSGLTYQVNLTFPLRGRAVAGPEFTWRSALRLWLDLVGAQGWEGAFAVLGTPEAPGPVLVSASPELFFVREGEIVESRPMKGTAPRDPDPALDAAHRHALASGIKTRAENLMVTDMVRNDLGRLSVPGGVSVPSLFEVEPYPSVWQMTSTVRARLRPGVSLSDLMRALFPCASITGAPKLRTQAVIAAVEAQPRGWYTGTLGWYRPGSTLGGPPRGRFSVLIRTPVFDGASADFRLDVGGGVVWDSTAEGEWDEAWAKTRFLTPTRRTFALTEALLWEPGTGWFLLDEHEERLAAACRDFGGALDPHWKRILEQALAAVPAGPAKVRVLVDPDFFVTATAQPLDEQPEVLSVALAPAPFTAETLLLRRYKTSNRSVYEEFRVPGADQTVYFNEKGELTESTSMNLVLDWNGRLVTPPLSSGLLDGTFRRRLLAEGRIVEAVLPVAALGQADAIWLVNSVRRWKAGRLWSTVGTGDL